MFPRLPRSFYTRDDVVQLARELLGKYVFTRFGGELTGGRIVETEAYHGRDDIATQKHLAKGHARTQLLYREGGLLYIYAVYRIHHLFNIVTNREGLADTVLIRALQPTDGVATMLQRRQMTEVKRNLTAGPGVMTQSLGLSKAHFGTDLVTSPDVWLEDRHASVPDAQIVAGPRVGIPYAEEHIDLPWRFSVRDSPWVSPAKGGTR
ncbi:DNA-3-methyladenine glycosylase [Catalinimonas alkaloidigena]|uniref:Putative 3-methyladenine DNA glycosylase n=1 Tax=Catalinimonas alkaloidigena TaxID=1075417 RepID=A0A1G9IR94_9BACT|nr:DNA-3-methyladenine glycosylase [Catalinimonas alkaloidigena]SDL27662.1 DNA-3-methyladenine glycosylase [Catalinimonas alkaloidigena]